MTDRGEFRRILSENERYTESFDRSALTPAPLSGLAIVACMDARLDVEETLGLRTGDAHIIRNAGGIATDDVIRSLIVSQQLLGTDEIVVIGHTRCGLLDADETALRARRQQRRAETSASSSVRSTTWRRVSAHRSSTSAPTHGSNPSRSTA